MKNAIAGVRGQIQDIHTKKEIYERQNAEIEKTIQKLKKWQAAMVYMKAVSKATVDACQHIKHTMTDFDGKIQ